MAGLDERPHYRFWEWHFQFQEDVLKKLHMRSWVCLPPQQGGGYSRGVLRGKLRLAIRFKYSWRRQRHFHHATATAIAVGSTSSALIEDGTQPVDSRSFQLESRIDRLRERPTGPMRIAVEEGRKRGGGTLKVFAMRSKNSARVRGKSSLTLYAPEGALSAATTAVAASS
jgi:hypothetical protein